MAIFEMLNSYLRAPAGRRELSNDLWISSFLQMQKAMERGK